MHRFTFFSKLRCFLNNIFSSCIKNELPKTTTTKKPLPNPPTLKVVGCITANRPFLRWPGEYKFQEKIQRYNNLLEIWQKPFPVYKIWKWCFNCFFVCLFLFFKLESVFETDLNYMFMVSWWDACTILCGIDTFVFYWIYDAAINL